MIPSTNQRPRARGRVALLAIPALVLCGCARTPAIEDAPRELPVDVYADTGRATTWRIDPPREPGPAPRATVWLAQVSPARSVPAEPPAVEPAAETLAFIPGAPLALAMDDDLKPPLPRARAPLAVPAGARGTVELDVRVDERGDVAEVLWAGGRQDTALVRAAVACARGMRFFPAQRAGRPVAVWCRQRFDFGGEVP